MPEVYIKPLDDWYPPKDGDPRDLTKMQKFTLGLYRNTGAIICRAWNHDRIAGFDGTLTETEVISDIVAPPYSVIEGVTPGIAIRVRPNYTSERFKHQEDFRLAVLLNLYEWATIEAKRLYSHLPSFDVDIDFIVGCGAHVEQSGMLVATWPDELDQPYHLRP